MNVDETLIATRWRAFT